ncbi:uncharacterized protein ppp1r3aa [Brachyhypopomus gauderio]|uniref:uncharacterized protein ppp1r3aa n=1 Tax=Brachyhypopomus gauderio TaxID=698409 RepID=UPI0040425AB0
MSAEEHRPSAAPSRPKPPALGPQLWDEDEDEEERAGRESTSPSRSSSDESEESEAEPPTPSYVARRKVSFADAFGLDLVSVKEFDIAGSDSGSGGGAAGLQDGKRYHLSRFFAVPSSNEELTERLRQNKLEVESVEFLPDTASIRGIVRVLNLSYHKVVFARVTTDGWDSHFDLLAQYVPGSSDGETDRFSFRFPLMSPFREEGARVEFCLRYETSTGTFWANNGGANYVLFCRCREESDPREKEGEREKETDENNRKGIKSCLKVVGRRSSTDTKPTDVSGEPSDAEPREGRNTRLESASRPSEAPEESRKALVERRSRRRSAQMAHMQDRFSRRDREGQLDRASPGEPTETGLGVVLSAPQLRAPERPQTSDDVQESGDQGRNEDASPTRTYRQNPLLSLDRGNRTSVGRPGVFEISPVDPAEQITVGGSAVSCADAWEVFLNGTDRSDADTSAPKQEGSPRAIRLPSHAERDPFAPGDEPPPGWGATGDAQESVPTDGQLGLFGAMESLESERSDRSELVRDEVLDYECAVKPTCASERSGGFEREPARERRGLGSGRATATPPFGLPFWGTPIGDDGSLLATQTEGGEGLGNLEAEGGVLPEVGGEEAWRKDTQGALGLTFAGLREELVPIGYSEGGGAFQRRHAREEGEERQEKENIREGNDNTEKTPSAHSEDPTALERGEPAENKGPNDPRVQTTETLGVPASERRVFDKEELDTRTECHDLEAFEPRGEEEAAVYPDPLKERHADTSAKPKAAPAEIEAADWHCESSDTKAESPEGSSGAAEVTEERKREGNFYTDSLSGEGPSSTRTVDTHKPPLVLTIHATSSPSGTFGWTETAGNSDPLLLPVSDQCFESPGEALRCRATQDAQETDGEGTHPALSPTMAVPSVGKILLVFCSLGFVSRALMYAALVVILITAYLHDLPVCLAIYLLSVCWWCGRGLKKQAETADSVD